MLVAVRSAATSSARSRGGAVEVDVEGKEARELLPGTPVPEATADAYDE